MERNFRTTHLQELKRKLELVDCPFVDEIDEEAVRSLLFQPSEARTKLLIWLVTAFDPEFESTLQNPASSLASRVESRLQKLLFVCHIMGLCSASDLEIIKGTAPEREQLTFWQNLLDLVVTEQLLHEKTKSTNSRVPNADVYKNTCQLMDIIGRQGITPGLFDKTIELFPPDIKKQLDICTKDKRAGPIPHQKDLVSILEDLEKSLELHRRQLESFKNEYIYTELSDSTVENLCKKLDIAYNINAQQLASFCMTYEHELQPWCLNKAKPKITGLGEVTDIVHELVTEYDKLQSDLLRLRTCHNSVNNKLNQDIPKIHKTSSSGLTKEKLAHIRHSAKVLEEAQDRL